MSTNPFEKFDLSGKSAFVTGGGTGIGYSISRALLQSGAKVMIAARRESVLADAAKQLASEANEGEVMYTKVDLSDPSSVSDAAEHANSALGGVDIFVANAAQELNQPIDEIDNDKAHHVHQVNVAANMALTRAFLPHMREKQWGRVILISSIMERLASAQEKVSLYCASKAALNAFGRVAALEACRSGITVNSINPGIYRTEMFEEVFGDLEKSIGAKAVAQIIGDLKSTTALGRLGKCEELEGVVQLLASDAGSFITGSDITVDGGMSIMLKPNPV